MSCNLYGCGREGSGMNTGGKGRGDVWEREGKDEELRGNGRDNAHFLRNTLFIDLFPLRNIAVQYGLFY